MPKSATRRPYADLLDEPRTPEKAGPGWGGARGTMFTIIGLVCTINMIVLISAVAWLAFAGRLDRERLADIGAILSSGDSVRQEAVARPLGRDDGEAVASAEVIARRDAVDEMSEIARERLESERQILIDEIDRRLATLQRDREALAAEQRVWRATRDAEIARRNDAQFRKTVQLMESSPRQAKQMLLRLMDRGEVAPAVRYLDAMSPRVAGRILREFRSAREQEIAGRLVEALGDPLARADDEHLVAVPES